MKNINKEAIINLKRKGYSYKQISQKIFAPLGTIKSILSRSDLTFNDYGICKNCGKPIYFVKGKRKKEYCSDICRYQWWNHNEPATYKTICPICHTEFQSAKKNKKYCTIECYQNSRLRGNTNE